MRHRTAADLTPGQDRFCRDYVLSDGNGVIAYRAAFPNTRHSKSRTVSKHASRLLALPKIVARIELYRGQVRNIVNADFQIEASRVIRELAAIALVDARELMSWGTERVPLVVRGKPVVIDGVAHWTNRPFLKLKNSDELTSDAASAVQAVKRSIASTGEPTVNLVLASKLRALEALARHCGLLSDNVSLRTAATGSVIELVSAQQPPDDKI